MSLPPCSVIIRSFNEERSIGRLLRGLMQQTVSDLEIILVDSGSTDGTRDIASRFGGKVIPITPDEFSFGRSLNLGLSAATGEFAVVASAHVYPVLKTWIEKLLDPFGNPAVGLTYGRQSGNSATKFSEHQVFAAWFPPVSNDDQKHPFCNNANAAIRRSVWQGLPYDETLTGLEDVDWAKRAMGKGWKIAYVADAAVIHVHNESARHLYNRYRREAMAFRRIFPREHFTLVDFARLFTANIARDWVEAGRRGVLLRASAQVAVFRLMQFWGTYRGFASGATVTRELRERFFYPRGGRKPGEQATPETKSLPAEGCRYRADEE